MQYFVLFSILLAGIFLLYTNGNMAKERPLLDAGLDPNEVKSFYDWFGSWQDYNSLYEAEPIRKMVEMLDLRTSAGLSVMELGCGTGSNAKEILDEYHHKIEKYVCMDISTTMVGLATESLKEFGEKVEVIEGNFITDLSEMEDGSFDIMYSTYVLDAIPNEETVKGMKVIKRLLKDGGKFGNTGLTRGRGLIASAVSFLWEVFYQISPMSMGGCRPSEFVDNFVEREDWNVIFHDYMTMLFMITSEVSVIQKK